MKITTPLDELFPQFFLQLAPSRKNSTIHLSIFIMTDKNMKIKQVARHLLSLSFINHFFLNRSTAINFPSITEKGISL